MTEFTDEDIPICCGECSPDVYIQGLEPMISHILETHKQYSLHEANAVALRWMETAYDEIDVQNAERAAKMKNRF